MKTLELYNDYINKLWMKWIDTRSIKKHLLLSDIDKIDKIDNEYKDVRNKDIEKITKIKKFDFINIPSKKVSFDYEHIFIENNINQPKKIINTKLITDLSLACFL